MTQTETLTIYYLVKDDFERACTLNSIKILKGEISGDMIIYTVEFERAHQLFYLAVDYMRFSKNV